MKSVLQKTYSRTEIRGDGQVIVVDYNDIRFEVVPCFKCNDGSFCYPDTHDGGSWKNTNPKPEIEAMNVLDKDSNGNLKNLCRMTRSWNYYSKVGMPGFLIDCLCYHFIETHSRYRMCSCIYYDEMCRDLFLHLSNGANIVGVMPGSDKIVWSKSDYMKSAEKAYDTSCEAIRLSNTGHEYTSRLKWRELFGDRFPAS